MTFLKSLWADLVEKNLWPIAMALLVALVAVPVVLGSGGEAPFDATALGATGATGGLGAQAQVVLDEPGATRRDRGGKLRDPFKQKPVPATGTSGATGTPAAAASTATLTAPTPEPSKATGGTAPATGATGSGGSPIPTPESRSRIPGLSEYVTEIRLGEAGDARTPRTVARLTPMPSTDQPSFVYLGVLSDRRTAVFLLSSDVKPSGRATCRPSKTLCETIEMRAGQTAKLTVTGDEDSVTRFTLTVDKVRRRGSAPKTTTTTESASADDETGTDRYTYDDDTGLLRRVRAAKAAKLGAHLPGTQDASTIDLANLDTSRAVTPPDAGAGTMPAFSPGL